MPIHQGGCLCGACRYETRGDPIRVTICHCKFCQRATGSAYMVEPIFALDAFAVTKGTPAIYDQRSAGSGKIVHVHFCRDCGTKLFLTFERFAGSCGVYAGTFDDPSWFPIPVETSKQIFIDEARPDSILPPDLPAFGQHATTNDGTPLTPRIYDRPQLVGAIKT